MTVEKKLIEKKLKIDPAKFAAAMDKLATDKMFQEKLDKYPLEVLEDLGIEVDEETREALKGKNFMEAMGVSEKEASTLQTTLQTRTEAAAMSRITSLAGSVSISPIATSRVTGGTRPIEPMINKEKDKTSK